MSQQMKNTLLTLSAFLVAFAILCPQLSSGYVGDDVHNSLSVRAAYGPQGVLGTSVVSRTLSDMAHWMGKGRLYPFAGYARLLFSVLDGNLLAYKVLLLGLTLLNLWQFRTLVLRLTASKPLSNLAVIAVPLFLQMRSNDDPLVSYHGLAQMTLFWTLLSLMMFVRYLDGRRARHLVLSVAAYLIALLTYEISLPFFLLHFVLAWRYPVRRSWRETLRFTMPPTLAAIAVATVTMGLRLTVDTPIAGGSTGMTYVPNFAPAIVLLTLAKQLSAAIPLTFAAGSIVMRTEYLEVLRQQLASGWPVAAAVAVALGAFVLSLIGLRQEGARRSESRESPTAMLALLGIAMLVLPDVLTSLSPVYQDALQWGLGHLGAYVSCFGAALLALAFASNLTSRPQGARSTTVTMVALALVIGAVGGLNHLSNRATIELVNQRWRYPSELVQRSLDAGILDPVPDGATLFLPDGRFWDTAEYYALLGSRSLNVISGWDAYAAAPPEGAVYVLDYTVPTTGGGWVALAAAEPAESGAATGTIVVRPMTTYVEPVGALAAAGWPKQPLWALDAPGDGSASGLRAATTTVPVTLRR